MRRTWVSVGARPEVRAADGGGVVIAGEAALFNVPTTIGKRFIETIAPTAFAASLTRNDEVVALFNHEASRVLGRRSAGTLRVWTDDAGLRYEIDANMADPEAVSVIEKIRRGDVVGSSFQFDVDPDGDSIEFPPYDGLPVRTLRSVRLIDVSPVTFPAFEGTSTGVRSEAASDAEILERITATRAEADAAAVLASRTAEACARVRRARVSLEGA